jgi:hypothetical protein
MQKLNYVNKIKEFQQFYHSLVRREKTRLKRITCRELAIAESTFSYKIHIKRHWRKLEIEKIDEIINLYKHSKQEETTLQNNENKQA